MAEVLEYYVVRCGLTPEAFFSLSWYEAALLAQQAEYNRQWQWLHTRTIRSAFTGEKPTAIIKLSLFDNAGSTGAKATSQEDAQRIINKYKNIITSSNGK